MNSEIINYNDGFLSINHVFDCLGFPAGKYFFSMLIKKMMSAQKEEKDTQATKEGFYRSRKGKRGTGCL